MLKKIVIMVTSIGLLTGCLQSMPDQQRTQVEGAAAGAVMGGLLGYAVDRERGAAVGAVVGGGVGFWVGHEIAKRKQGFATTEAFLDAEIARVAEYNRNTQAYNRQTRQEITRLEREVDTLQAQYAAGRIQRDRLENRRSQLQRRLQTSRELETTLAREHEVQVAILEEQRTTRKGNDPYMQKLTHEVNTLQANLETLREDSLQLARIDQRLSV